MSARAAALATAFLIACVSVPARAQETEASPETSIDSTSDSSIDSTIDPASHPEPVADAEPPAEPAPVEPQPEAPRVELGAPEPPPAPPRDEEEERAPEVVDEREIVTSRPGLALGRQGAVWMELGLTAGGPDTASVVGLSGELGLRYRVADVVVANVSWGLTYAATDVSGETTIGGAPTPYAASLDLVEPGNPTIGGAFVHRASWGLLEVGLAMSIPTAAREEPGADADGAARRASSEVSHRAALAMRGYRDAFRWAPERFSLAIPFRASFLVGPVVIEVDGALATMFPVIGDRNAEVDTLVDLGLGAGAIVAGPLALGARLAGVGRATGSLTPAFTLSAEPWVRLRFDPVQITARGVLSLTGADRLGGNRGPSFGLLLGAAVEF